MRCRSFIFYMFAAFTFLPAGCRADRVCTLDLAPRLRLGTTTSVENSGLLPYLLPHFEERTGIHVDVIAVGTGNAIQIAQNGDVDVILVHSPQAEIAFVDQGYGVNRRSVMANQFVVVGPRSDPAGIRGMADAAAAMLRIEQAGGRFVSRGDGSGTHIKEQDLRRAVGSSPRPGQQYVEAGQGMAATLRMADEMQGYCLTDIATFLMLGESLPDLEVLVEGDQALDNPYHVIAVNPGRHEGINYLEAMLLIGWLTSPEAQELIRDFTHEGQPLFTPAIGGSAW